MLDIFIRAHGFTVEETIKKVLALEKEEKDILFKEYFSNPDHRFSDNLLIACSALSRDWKKYSLH